MSGCTGCGGQSMVSYTDEGKLEGDVFSSDIRTKHSLADLVWVKIENYTDHSQGLPSPTGKNSGSYGTGRNGLELIVHKDDVAVWPTIFVEIDKIVEPIGTPEPSSATVKLDEPAELLANLANEGSVTADLTEIDGIGPAGAQKLQDASIVTFTQLAAMEAQQLADLLGQAVSVEKAQGMIDDALSIIKSADNSDE